MSPLVIANIVLAIVVVLYAVGLFFYLLKTRYKFVQLGKKG